MPTGSLRPKGAARVFSVAERAVARANASIRPGELLAASSVVPRGNADLLRFTVTNSDPVLAGRLATAYAEAFSQSTGSGWTPPISPAPGPTCSRASPSFEAGRDRHPAVPRSGSESAGTQDAGAPERRSLVLSRRRAMECRSRRRPNAVRCWGSESAFFSAWPQHFSGRLSTGVSATRVRSNGCLEFRCSQGCPRRDRLPVRTGSRCWTARLRARPRRSGA